MVSKIASLRTELAQFLPQSSLEFVMAQITMAQRHPRGRRWTAQQKAFALSIFHSSPKTYRLLRKVFALPSPRILKKMVQNIQIYPGVNEHILEALKLKTAHLSSQDKLVVLAFDEMSIRCGLSYDQARDVVEGVAETETRSEQLANHAVVFMIRSLVKKWKQPVAYYTSSGPIVGCVLKSLLLCCIDRLESVGLTVVATVCDQGSNNVNLYEKQFGMTKEKPYFLHESKKVYALYDPPHLLKSIRNNLKKHGFTIKTASELSEENHEENHAENHDVSWEHVVSFYEADSAKAVRIAPKLTRAHIDLPPFKDLRVYLAAQVLSHTVSTGIAVMIQWDVLPEEAKYTAEFLGRFDKLFNCFNSRTFSSKSEMSHGFSENSGHKEFLQESLLWLQNVKTKGRRKLPCLRGWEWHVNCLLQLWHTLAEEHHLRYLLTSRLNQDCVENFFSVIRGKGSGYDNPDTRTFRALFAQTLVDSILDKGTNTNCTEDLDQFLLTLGSFPTSSITLDPFIVLPSPYVSHVSTLPDNVRTILSACAFHSSPSVDENVLTVKETNVLAYIGGYIVRKVRNKVCVGCYEKLVYVDRENDSDTEHAENLVYVNKKRYLGAKDGLICPSKSLLTMLTDIELQYQKLIDNIMYSDQVKKTLVSNIVQKVDSEAFTCHTCNLHLTVTYIMVNIRFHHTLKLANQSLIQDKSRKNRKVLKFAHF